MSKPVICWWSGGVTSAVACKLSIEHFGLDNCRIIMIDTANEHEDTYRFKKDCERLYNKDIETITAIGNKYDSIDDVWHDFNSLNVAHGAICSSELKRQVRIDFQKRNEFKYRVFGFDFSEPKRAVNIKKNWPVCMPIFPLLMFGLSKNDCFKILEKEGVKIPVAYELGFNNNNCLNTGCVQGGISYWKRYKKHFPLKFDEMAEREHVLTNDAGKPVTCLRDQSNYAKQSGIFQVFLKPHKNYPNHKDLSQMRGRDDEDSFECNGFCGVSVSEHNKQMKLL
jgi:hypothetical protein